MKRKATGRYYLIVLIAAIVVSAVVVFGNDISEYFKGLSSNNDPTETDPSDSTSHTGKETTPPSTSPPQTTPPPATVTPTTQIEEIDHIVVDECRPENFKGFSYNIVVNGKVVQDYKRENEIYFERSDDYITPKGITTFQGSNWRDRNSYGTVDIKEAKLEPIWYKSNGYIDIWTGTGWTGQPVIVEWDEAAKSIMNINTEKKAKAGLKEVILATLDGKIYFMDLEDGNETRPPINIGYPHKGNVSVDPRGYPLLYAGQGVGTKNGVEGPFGFRIYSLINQERLLFLDGRDQYSYRGWYAFDAGSLVDKKTDTLIQVGESGIIYSVDLNTEFNALEPSVKIDPEIVRFRYKSPYDTRIGFESSPIGYRNYIYCTDNTGLLLCLDINTLKPVWLRNITDDTDSTMVLEEVNINEVYLYTACEVDWQGSGGKAHIRKIHALTGELMWEYSVDCFYNTITNGGAMASPILGKHDIDNLIIYNLAKPSHEHNNGSLLVALNRDTGKVVWSNEYTQYSWSTPAAIYTPEGKSHILFCDSVGDMRLLEGLTGKELDKINLGNNIEASPAVFGDIAVVATRGQRIWGVRIK